MTADNLVTLVNGSTIMGMKEGVEDTGEWNNANMTNLGVVQHSEGTFSVTKADGQQATLPHTGEAQNILLTILETVLLFRTLRLLYLANHQEYLEELWKGDY